MPGRALDQASEACVAEQLGPVKPMPEIDRAFAKRLGVQGLEIGKYRMCHKRPPSTS
jgi:hypothetical protein